ncbi:MAG: hypothetical protein LBL21_00725 [Rickettsiales bacterium]|jgi:hypothetical protein|nr:hypothetical protein [Rickettsiales bacterium]
MLKKLALLALWTMLYAAGAALFFRALFGFDIWSAPSWRWLARATIRGFSGLAFGASMLAAVPIYIASAWRVLKTGKFPLGLPKPPTKKKDEDSKQAANEQTENRTPVPEMLPDELREPYARLHSGMLSKNAMDFIKAPAPADDAPRVENTAGAMMPLPDSFDAPTMIHNSAPVFRDIDFGEESPVIIDEENGQKTATYVFDDPDFWVADDGDDWFATGKQIASPIKLLLGADADRRVLVLKTKNIMNLDALVPGWEEKGITVMSYKV